MTACTEKEAAEKWCPHARKAIVEADGGLFAGNMTVGGQWTGCVGSRCMQWRWYDSPERFGEPLGEMRTGYCGLAGRP